MNLDLSWSRAVSIGRTSWICAAIVGAAGLPLVLGSTAARAQGAAPTPRSTVDQADSKIRPLRADTPRPTPPASAPSARLRPLDETAAGALAPGDRQPERPISAPQLNLRLGRTPPAPTAAETRAAARSAGRTGGIDDSAARCGAQSDPQARAQCRSASVRAGDAGPAR